MARKRRTSRGSLAGAARRLEKGAADADLLERCRGLPLGEEDERLLQVKERIVRRQAGRRLHVEAGKILPSQLPVDRGEVQVGKDGGVAEAQHLLEHLRRIDELALVEKTDRVDERGVQVAGDKARVLRVDAQGGLERLDGPAEASGAGVGEAQQAPRGGHVGAALEGAAQRPDRGGHVAEGEEGAAEEEMAGRRAGLLAQEEAECLDRLRVLAERVAAAAQVQQRLGEPARAAHEEREQLRCPGILTAPARRDPLLEQLGIRLRGCASSAPVYPGAVALQSGGFPLQQVHEDGEESRGHHPGAGRSRGQGDDGCAPGGRDRHPHLHARGRGWRDRCPGHGRRLRGPRRRAVRPHRGGPPPRARHGPRASRDRHPGHGRCPRHGDSRAGISRDRERDARADGCVGADHHPGHRRDPAPLPAGHHHDRGHRGAGCRAGHRERDRALSRGPRRGRFSSSPW